MVNVYEYELNLRIICAPRKQYGINNICLKFRRSNVAVLPLMSRCMVSGHGKLLVYSNMKFRVVPIFVSVAAQN